MPTKRRAFEEWLPGHKLAVARFREQTGDMIREIIDEWAAETAAQKERREQKFLRKQMTAKERMEKKKENKENKEKVYYSLSTKKDSDPHKVYVKNLMKQKKMTIPSFAV